MEEMKKYTGTKEVSAKPMSLGEFRAYSGRDPYANTENPGDSYMGYLVKCEDGYESWSPKNVFEKAYQCTETFVDRLRLEYNIEVSKLNKLSAFIKSDLFNKLSEHKKKQLYIQENTMQNFVKVLFERLMDELTPEMGCTSSSSPNCENINKNE